MMRPARGYVGIRFECPLCGTVDKWGTAGVRGHCRGEAREGSRRLVGLRCRFEWRRADDWRVFTMGGRPFVSREEYERAVTVRAFRTPAVFN